MAFKSIASHLVKFNSAVSCNFLEMYEDAVKMSIEESNSKIPHKTFAPSQFRCERLNWFRIRGVNPDTRVTDPVLDWTAEIGTACHSIIQENIVKYHPEMWVDVKEYILNLYPDANITKSGYETQIELAYPPIRFACDGLLNIDGHLYLLEIKTSEFSSFQDLTDVKPVHLDQIKCYGSLLNIDRVLVLYQDRQYGNLKCFEKTITNADKAYVEGKISRVLEAVRTNLAPDRLPKGDPWCSSTFCPYYRKCKEWG